jgi:hypothetical protein
MASHAYAAPVWEGPTGTGTGLSNAMGGKRIMPMFHPQQMGLS